MKVKKIFILLRTPYCSLAWLLQPYHFKSHGYGPVRGDYVTRTHCNLPLKEELCSLEAFWEANSIQYLQILFKRCLQDRREEVREVLVRE